jgi:hypothetical protein
MARVRVFSGGEFAPTGRCRPVTKTRAAFAQKQTTNGTAGRNLQPQPALFRADASNWSNLSLGAEIAARVNCSYRRSTDDRKRSIAQVLARGREWNWMIRGRVAALLQTT